MVLLKIIFYTQNAFVPNRDIHDNILIAHEILNTFSKNQAKGRYMAIKLDIEIAYDGMEWNFIKKCFIDLSFCEKWTKWMQCTTTTFSRIIVDGKTWKEFQHNEVLFTVTLFFFYFHYLLRILRHIYLFYVNPEMIRYRNQANQR